MGNDSTETKEHQHRPLPWFVLAWIAAEIACWAYILPQPRGWQRKFTTLFLFEAGLYEAEISPGAFNMLATALIRDLLHRPAMALAFQTVWVGGDTGTYILEELDTIFCNGALATLTNYCYGFDELWKGSLVMLVAAVSSMVFFLFGGVLLHRYWFIRPTKSCYAWMIGCLATAPLLLLGGIITYGILSMPVEDMEPAGVYGYDYYFTAAIVLSVCAWFPLLVQTCCLGRHPDVEELDQIVLVADPVPSYGSSPPLEGEHDEQIAPVS
mmetsp:Transcript_46828/g.85775  ORF Transcript_46828/g.85775 Transcript_46828/m.85775 type:complete len:268 (-) Transcript_46828:37-840(-)